MSISSRRKAIREFFKTPDLKAALEKAFIKGPDNLFLHALPRFIGDKLRDFTMLQTEGLEHVPRSGRVMIVPNHSGLLGWDASVLQNEEWDSSQPISS